MKINKNSQTKDKTMRFIYALSLLSFLLFFGCDQGIDITNPEDSATTSYQMIKLPPKKAGLSVETTFSKTETIDGEDGGTIQLWKFYRAEDGHYVYIYVKLKVKEDSFDGEVDITLTVDDEYAAISFSPHMEFDVPLELDMTLYGLDLEALNLTTGDYDFVFVDDNGNTEVVGYNAIHVNESQGKLWITKAKLNHFSRYGFVNRTF